MYDITLDVSPALELLRNLRQRVEAVREVVFADVQGPITEHVNKAIADFIAPYPDNSATHPFVFATRNSRIKYFILMRTGAFGSQSYDPKNNDATWQRTNTLADSWVISTDLRSNSAFMQIDNVATDERGNQYPAAVY